MLDQREPPYHAVGVIAQKNTERILFQSDLSLQIRDLRIRGVEYLFSLQDVEPCGDAVLEAVLRQLDGIFLGLDCVAGDLELQVKGKKREIVTGYVAHQREDLGPLGKFGSQKLSARRFGGAAQLAKKVQLK